MAAANKVAYYGSQIRSRLIWLVVTAAIAVGIYTWMRSALTQSDVTWLFGLSIVYSLLWLGLAVFGWVRARAALSSISPQVALAVDRNGIWAQGTGMAWPEIAGVKLTRGPFGGTPRLNVSRHNGPEITLSLADLDVMPSTIDSAVRAYSSGMMRMDTSTLGN